MDYREAKNPYSLEKLDNFNLLSFPITISELSVFSQTIIISEEPILILLKILILKNHLYIYNLTN